MEDSTQLSSSVRRLRTRQGMSQNDLAVAADVSVDVVQRLEQGRRTPKLENLYRIARALDVGIADLFGAVRPVREELSQPPIVASLRDALINVADLADDYCDEEVPNLRELERATIYATGTYWAGQYALLGEILPRLLVDTHTAVHSAPVDSVAPYADLSAQVRQIAAAVLLRLDAADLALGAARDAVKDAKKSNDPLRVAAIKQTMAHVLIRQGLFPKASTLAQKTAESIQGLGTSRQHLVVYGGLLLRAAGAAGRANDISGAESLIAESRDAAARVGSDSTDYMLSFGPSQVTVQQTDTCVISENYSGALRAARRMPRNSSLNLLGRFRHLSDVSLAQTREGQVERATDTLLTMESAAPNLMRAQRLPNLILRELLDLREQGRLRELAVRQGVVD
ncbi:helix-turn-helix domain-containing protein [Allokutzneria sp. A3M-2-11 16]|uniref:helix-turn-helix domain-containing protein n=1 Tax=Allokutzneria sp. A3M-2-11 16 TaxID=2962043 RepID=UPI0020B8804A|nr:helix-turn-helix domain-containing protein [Allokutzneria sp. A3M-2-11 16]MCP3800662.1 helix-turn-helix domain-containing protein [Allokutzneria sp. A3M-2-11 16]